jgi:hypothetical protein
MRTRLSSRLSLLFLTFALVMIVFPAMAFAEVASPDGTTATSTPTITSDKDDYAPGELVTLTGSNWQPGESVHINVDDDQTKTWNRDVDVTADASGNISDSFNLPDWFVATYKVTATGDRSGTVTYGFTDANPSDIVLTPTNNTVERSGSATYDVRVLMGGSNANCTTTLSASGLPTGANASFSGANPRTGNSNYTSTMTVTTTGNGPAAGRTPLGTDTFTVTMTRGSDCQGSGNISKDTTLVVNPRPPSNLQVTDTTQTSISLSWTASPDAADINNYRIQYGLSGATVSPAKDATSYTITGLNAGTQYYIVLNAYVLANNTNHQSSGVDTIAKTDPADSTAPTTTPSATVPSSTGTSPYTAGSWTNKDVTLSLSAQDNAGGSGVKEIRYTTNGTEPTKTTGTVYSAPFTVSSTSTVKYLAVDNAGNAEAFKSFQVNIDKVAPAPNCGSASANWLANDASIACSPTDGGGSGLASNVPATFNLVTNVPAGTEDANASTDSRTISDAAGNTATAGPISGNMIDKKAPEVLPADVTNQTWRNSSLSQSFTSSDGGSGLAPGQNLGANGSFTLTAALESANATTPTEVSKDVKDAVGNTTTRKVSALIDLTKPTIDASVTNNPDANSGWYNISTGGPVVHFECGDALSGIATGACPADHTITTEGPNQGYSDSVSDRAGNTNSAGVSGLKVDLTAPDLAGAPDLLATSDSGDTSDNLTNDKTPTFDVTAEAGSTVRLYAEKNGTETLLGSATATNGVATITSGQELSDGAYNVYAKVTDQAGNVSSTTGIKVTIVTIDTAAPIITVPSDKTVEATSSAGAKVTYTASANDAVDGNRSVNCTPPSGSTFPLGETTVNCSANDTAGNEASSSFKVTVVDTTGPVLSLPADKTVEATSSAGAKVTYTASANDAVTGSRPVNCTPPSESTFPLGETTVNCSANDGSGNSSSGTFKVTVVDTTAPVIAAHADVNATATGANGALVSYASPGTTDAVDGNGTANCTPVSGSQFAVGSTTVTCTAKDAAGNSATPTTFKVNVAYAWSNFHQPINVTGAQSVFKLGSTVPVKFNLTGASAGITDGTFYLKYIYLGAGDGLGELETVATTTGTTGTMFRYDATSGQYIYNWSTKSVSKPGNYELRVYSDAAGTVLLGKASIEIKK